MDSRHIDPIDCFVATVAYLAVTLVCSRLFPARDVTNDILTAVIVSTLMAAFIVLSITLVRRAIQRRRTSRELRLLLRKLADAQRVERNRVSRELHDGVCQMLLATRYWLELAHEQKLQSNEAFADYFERGLRQLDSAIDETRRVSCNLKPVLLSYFDLSEAIRHMVHEFTDRTQIQVSLEGVHQRLNRRVPQNAHAALLRIVQEALSNIEKHSAASRVSIEVREHPDEIWLRISDNGRGFDAALSAQATCGSGMRNMRERAAEIGGVLVVRPCATGTNIFAHFPLPLEYQECESDVPHQTDSVAS